MSEVRRYNKYKPLTTEKDVKATRPQLLVSTQIALKHLGGRSWGGGWSGGGGVV